MVESDWNHEAGIKASFTGTIALLCPWPSPIMSLDNQVVIHPAKEAAKCERHTELEDIYRQADAWFVPGSVRD